MTEKEMIAHKELLKSYIEPAAGDTDMAELSKLIADNYVIMIPDEKTPGFVVLGSESASFKPGNICFDLKNAAIKTIEWAVGFTKPDSLENAFRLIIKTAIWITRITKADVSDKEASLLYWLHCNNMYERLEDEQIIITQFYEYYRDSHRKAIELLEIDDAINHLYSMKCIDIVNGKICLVEKVWGRR